MVLKSKLVFLQRIGNLMKDYFSEKGLVHLKIMTFQKNLLLSNIKKKTLTISIKKVNTLCFKEWSIQLSCG